MLHILEADQGGGTTTGPATGGSAIQKQQPGKAEHKLYFYHPDHLGSTGSVTDEFGAVYQHLQYFPFGETWTEEASNTDRIPYLFTGKELDEETGLYYFGARYYDPRASLWVSDDPALNTGEYLPKWPSKMDEIEELLKNPASYWQNKLPGEGGVFNAKNLNGMIYGHHNPVRFSDPDGRTVFNWTDKAVRVKMGNVVLDLRSNENTDRVAEDYHKSDKKSKFLSDRNAKGTKNANDSVSIGKMKDADGFYVEKTPIDSMPEGSIYKTPNGADVNLVDTPDGVQTSTNLADKIMGKLGDILGQDPSGYNAPDSRLSNAPDWNPMHSIVEGDILQ